MSGLKIDQEEFFYWTMGDLEDLLDSMGAEFVVEHCKIDNAKLFALHKALQKHFVMENQE